VRLFRLSSIASIVLVLIATGASIAAQSVKVVPRYSPEEVETGKREDVYEPIFEKTRKKYCAPGTIERYKSELIPLAEKSSFLGKGPPISKDWPDKRTTRTAPQYG
jgi:hypothetical protein